MDKTQSTDQQQTWEVFIEAGRRKLKVRCDDQLAKLIGEVLPGESPVELERIALEDKRKAEEGLVELRGSHKVVVQAHR